MVWVARAIGKFKESGRVMDSKGKVKSDAERTFFCR